MPHVRKVDASQFPELQKIAKRYFNILKPEVYADFEGLPKTGYILSGEGYVRAIDSIGTRVAGFRPNDHMKLWVGEEFASPMEAEVYFIGRTEDCKPKYWKCDRGRVQEKVSCSATSDRIVSRIQLVAGKWVEENKPIVEILDIGKNPIRFQSEDW